MLTPVSTAMLTPPAFAGTRRVTTVPRDNTILRTPAEPVDITDIAGNKTLQKLIDDMVDTMKQQMGIGIAAPQVGEGLRIFIRRKWKGLGAPEAIINPEITDKSARTVTKREGCLSAPNRIKWVARSKRVTLSGFDRNGEPVQYRLRGMDARIAQHELDHLNGRLIIDY